MNQIDSLCGTLSARLITKALGPPTEYIDAGLLAQRLIFRNDLGHGVAVVLKVDQWEQNGESMLICPRLYWASLSCPDGCRGLGKGTLRLIRLVLPGCTRCAEMMPCSNADVINPLPSVNAPATRHYPNVITFNCACARNFSYYPKQIG